MGATFSSIQVRADSQEAVVESLTGLLKEPSYVSPAVGGWVGVYPEGAEATDALAVGLSLRLATAVLDWSVYDSDVFTYSLYESGTLRDEFNSAPGYFEGMLDEEEEEEYGSEKIDPARVQGDPQALLPYCVPGTTPAAIQEVLHPAELAEADAPTAAQLPDFLDAGLQQAAKMLGMTADALRQGVTQRMREKYTFAEHQAADLASLLGMDEQLTSVGVSDSEPDSIAAYTKEDFRLAGNADYSQQYKNDKLWSLHCWGGPKTFRTGCNAVLTRTRATKTASHCCSTTSSFQTAWRLCCLPVLTSTWPQLVLHVTLKYGISMRQGSRRSWWPQDLQMVNQGAY